MKYSSAAYGVSIRHHQWETVVDVLEYGWRLFSLTEGDIETSHIPTADKFSFLKASFAYAKRRREHVVAGVLDKSS